MGVLTRGIDYDHNDNDEYKKISNATKGCIFVFILIISIFAIVSLTDISNNDSNNIISNNTMLNTTEIVFDGIRYLRR